MDVKMGPFNLKEGHKLQVSENTELRDVWTWGGWSRPKWRDEYIM